MPAQTTTSKYWFGEGTAFEVSTDGGSSYSNIGTFAGGVTLTHNFTKSEVEVGNNDRPCSKVTSQTMAVAPTALLTYDLNLISKLGGGLYTYTAVAGTPVSGAEQVVASGAWGYNDFILIENQNYNLGAITINSVTGGTDGALVADTDYFVGTNERGEYGIFIIDSATVTTLSQTMTIDYDYTPSTGKKITSGTSSLVLDDYIIRIRHYNNVGLTTYDAEATIWKAALDSGIQFNFKGVNEEGMNEVTVAFTGSVDSSRTDGDQLFSLYIADSLLQDC